MRQSRWRASSTWTLLLVVACASCAGAASRAPVARAPLVRVVADTTTAPLVNPPNTPVVNGDLRSLLALQYLDVLIGAGAAVQGGRCVYAHYTGWLTDGTKFDSSRDTTSRGTPREPIGFPLGARRVIAGWDLGFDGMRVGGRRRLVIPYPLAYGEAGRPPVIPPRATLVFDVELLAVQDTLPRAEDAPMMPGAPPRCASWGAIADSMAARP